MGVYYKIQSREQDSGWRDYTNNKMYDLNEATKHFEYLNSRKPDPVFNFMFRLVRVEQKEIETIIIT